MTHSDFRVTLLGTGVPIPSPDRFGPCTLVEAGERRFLIDAGRGAAIRLYQLKIPIGRIDVQLLTHYHSDHTANANDFAGATWIVQKAERDVMFAEKPQGIIQPAHFSALKNAKTKLLDNEDFDVFGDGTVVVKSSPGHTPGHQVVYVKLAKAGPILLAGDLYHYPEERTTGRIPTFEFNVEQSRAARAKIEAFLKQSGAQLWIEHDIATHAKLPKSPAYLE